VNVVFKFLYLCKWYFDLGVSQISWFVGKLPEVMATIWLLEKLGYDVPSEWIVPVCLVGALCLGLLGLLWKKWRLYDTEVLVDASKNPVSNELYLAAKKINRSDKL